MYRIFEKSLHYRTHKIENVPIHLPEHQSVYIDEDDNVEKLNEKLKKESKLMAFFNLCQKDEFAKKLTYDQVP
jgi:hypothetical protein